MDNDDDDDDDDGQVATIARTQTKAWIWWSIQRYINRIKVIGFLSLFHTHTQKNSARIDFTDSGSDVSSSSTEWMNECGIIIKKSKKTNYLISNVSFENLNSLECIPLPLFGIFCSIHNNNGCNDM